MKQIGIMTFHAAHNYGSVLQAYATQRTVEKLGYSCEIINYRLPNQRAFYNGLYSARFGRREFLRRLARLPEHRKRVAKSKKFESFITSGKYLRVTEREYSDYGALQRANLDYDILLSGSDQVWSRHCQAEFLTEPPESILGYYLAFGREDAARVAFSSSLGVMTQADIAEYLEYLSRYDHISVREPESAELLRQMLGREVAATLDPTLMLNGEEWKLEGTYDPPERYALLYTLRNPKRVRQMIQQAKRFADRRNLKLICITPFSPAYLSGVRSFADCGPLDFLSYMRGAEFVITDSFHGNAFSINMEKPFVTFIYGTKDIRKRSMLSQFGLTDRILPSYEALAQLSDIECDFTEARQTLARRREESLNYLRNALEDVIKEE